MKIPRAALFVVPLVVLPLLAATTIDECKIEESVKAYHCADCDGVFEKKQLVSDKTIYHCADCEVIEHKQGDCEWCQQPLKEKTTGKGVCPECFVKTGECDACLKVYYECPECSEVKLEPGQCTECEEKDGPTLEKQTSLALIVYVCDGCYSPTVTPGRCVNEKCDHEGKPREKYCKGSGTFPHGPKQP